MSSCFFSSRLKMRISRSSEPRKRRTAALPKDPVPPVMRSVLPSNMAGAPDLQPVRPGKGRTDHVVLLCGVRIRDEDRAELALEDKETAGGRTDDTAGPEQGLDVLARARTAQERQRYGHSRAHVTREREIV